MMRLVSLDILKFKEAVPMLALDRPCVHLFDVVSLLSLVSECEMAIRVNAFHNKLLIVRPCVQLERGFVVEPFATLLTSEVALLFLSMAVLDMSV